ncbi:hypothetical protein [Streptomyces sp. NBC_01092]|uniref:hypothetical protein n=1 Tax=Streptomyces sp. NBC_01092 TaxID=2903748 RepID=UPI003864F1B6|nr:hypothetical protein OG254_39600 [Streptomyces sp. NBC_01092]
MSVDQLPARVREFVNYLDGLMARLDQGGGWCGVFWQRDPEGMRACLDGREMPPWDVVESLLHDLAAQYGPGGADPEAERARALHTAALAAYDARPGARDALGDRLDVMLREQRYAAERQVELGRLLASATSREEAEAIRLDLAWARDDHERATSRCAELRTRAADLDHRAARARGQAVLRDRVGDGGGFHDHGGGEGGGAAGDWSGGGELGEDAFRGGGGGGVGGSPAAGGGERRPGVDPTGRTGPAGAAAPSDRPDARSAPAPATFADPDPDPAPPETPTSKQRKRRRGGARFAGMVEEESAPVVVPPAEAPVLPTLPAQADRTGRTPRGARFAGAEDGGSAASAESWAEPMDPVGRQEVAATVGALVRLRGEGRSGEAHVLLVEAAYWPAGRFPLLAAEMQRAGLGADWATLLWEAASLPAERLVAAADALTAAGRAEDGEQILRQGVSRPAPEIGQAVLGLAGEGRRREVRALLDAYVRVRTPEEAARSVAPDPRTLVPLLLEAAQGVSDECQWDLVHALRVAGFTA